MQCDIVVLDHTEVLGDTLEKIAETKAGIFKENGHAVIYRGTPSVEAVFERVCAEKNTVLAKADFDSLNLKKHTLDGQVFDCGDRKDLVLPLLGDHQLHNASVVLSVVDTLKQIGWNISEQNILRLSKVKQKRYAHPRHPKPKIQNGLSI